MLITDDFLMMLIFFFMAMLLISFMRRAMSSTKPSSSNAQSTSTAKPQAVSKTQIAEDIKATKTSQIADAVSILDDLESTSSNYRHYCELVGSSMASSGVIAPYSKREVAYYDIKCYRIDARYGGGQEETLIAHEHSFDPFFFTDASCDKPVYIDLESFGDNVILVNSTNHIEGPNSEFAKAVGENTSSSTGRSGTAYAMVAHRPSRLGNVLRGAAHALRDALTPRSPLQPAYALADGGELLSAEAPQVFDHVKFDRDDRDGLRGRGGRGPQQRPRVTIQLGGYGNVMPPHLGDFMGPFISPM